MWATKRLLVCLLLTLPLLVAALSTSVDAFPTKDITFVVPYSAGGGFDVLARAVAPYLEKYLPGDHHVVVRNVAGAGGIIGINTVLNAAPDGHTIGVFNMPGHVVPPIVGQADYDLRRVEWIGQAANVTYVAAASRQSGLKTLDDLRSAGLLLGGNAGLTDSASVSAAIAADVMGFRVQPVPHPGSTEGILSTVRGDTQFTQFPFSSLRMYLVDSDDLTPLWVYAPARLPELPHVPTVGELGYPELLATVSLRRMIGTTPGTPSDRVAVLRRALEQAMNDPELLEHMNRGSMEPEYLPGEETAAMVEQMVVDYTKYAHLLE